MLHPLHHDNDEESDGCNLEWRLEWWTIDDAAQAQRGEKAKSVRDCLPVSQIKIQIQIDTNANANTHTCTNTTDKEQNHLLRTRTARKFNASVMGGISLDQCLYFQNSLKCIIQGVFSLGFP